MRSRIFTVCILLTSFFLSGCIDLAPGSLVVGGGQFTAGVGNIRSLFIAEEEVDVAFYSSSGSEVLTAPTLFVTTYKDWIIPQGEQDVSPRSGDLAGHRVQNKGTTPLYIFFQVSTERINGQKYHAFPSFQYLRGTGWSENGSLRLFNVPTIPDFSAVLEAYRVEAECPDLAACEYVIIVPPGESRIFRYADE